MVNKKLNIIISVLLTVINITTGVILAVKYWPTTPTQEPSKDQKKKEEEKKDQTYTYNTQFLKIASINPRVLTLNNLKQKFHRLIMEDVAKKTKNKEKNIKAATYYNQSYQQLQKEFDILLNSSDHNEINYQINHLITQFTPIVNDYDRILNNFWNLPWSLMLKIFYRIFSPMLISGYKIWKLSSSPYLCFQIKKFLHFLLLMFILIKFAFSDYFKYLLLMMLGLDYVTVLFSLNYVNLIWKVIKFILIIFNIFMIFNVKKFFLFEPLTKSKKEKTSSHQKIYTYQDLKELKNQFTESYKDADLNNFENPTAEFKKLQHAFVNKFKLQLKSFHAEFSKIDQNNSTQINELYQKYEQVVNECQTALEQLENHMVDENENTWLYFLSFILLFLSLISLEKFAFHLRNESKMKLYIEITKIIMLLIFLFLSKAKIINFLYL